MLAIGPIAPGIALRAANVSDRQALFAWHKAAYHDHIERLWRWDEYAQQRDFGARLLASPPRVVVVDGRDAGYVQTRLDTRSLHLENIVLVDRVRNRGVGSLLIRRLQARALEDGLPMTLRVFRSNRRARLLYTRLGFVPAGGDATHLDMRWWPSG